MLRLALASLLLPVACARVADRPETRTRIPIDGRLSGELRFIPVDATHLILLAQRDEPDESGDGLWVVDLAGETVQERHCQPASHTRGYGASVCVSADGRHVLVGAYSPTHEREHGHVFVYRWPEFELEFEAVGDKGGDGFGSSLAEIGDIDGDARPDYAVGAPYSGHEDPNPGVLALVSGTDGRILRRIEGDEIGRALASCGDCDGDGRPDLAVLDGKALVVRSGRDLHELRRLEIHGGYLPMLIGGPGLALLEDDGGSWPYSSHKTVTAWSAGQFERVCQWKPDRYAELYPSPGDPSEARIVYPEGNQLVSIDARGDDERELAPLENQRPRAAFGIPAGGPTRWRTAVALGNPGGRGNELLLTTR